MTGRVIRTDTKIGTVSERNQKNAIKIKAMTGVERMTDIGSSNKSFKTFEDEHKKPRKKPAIIQIKNETTTLKDVKQKFFQNSSLKTESTMVLKTRAGFGKISGAPITPDEICQIIIMMIREIRYLENFLIIFSLIIKIIFRKIYACRIRCESSKDFQKLFNFIFCIVCRDVSIFGNGN